MKVILADDQAKVRSALRLWSEHLPDIEILGEAVNATGLLDWVKATSPDIILLDWELPGMPGTELLPRLHSLQPGLHVIALSGQPKARQEALNAGAEAFVSRAEPPERLLAAIDACRGANGSS